MNFSNFFIPFLVVFCLTPLVRKSALALKITDKADGDPLKIHNAPVALLGGVVIFLGFLIGLLAHRQVLTIWARALLTISGGGTLLLIIGVWDDIKPLSPGIRIVFQIGAGLLLFLGGIHLECTPVIFIGVVFTILYVIGAVNAFNLVDGMDGLCAAMFLISSIGFFIIGVQETNRLLVILSGTLAMSVLGFLPYNLHPARIFLGDGGSGFLGFMCAVMAIISISPYSTGMRFLTSLMILGIPVLDMAAAILRRAVARKHLFMGDRSHLYDFLLKKKMTQFQVWSIMCILQLIVVAVGIAIR